ncbi:cytochrome P450 [Durotheca rogersii]|uniref:cytochrome P450 n=1 Tax=Durotheca rogersii TaxID=419775 RepID=UPI0022206313|nr:cytochrome P450 [Durotheca rogersii]KAI5863832.1 cytochrome P450 [Durotheca rogersii]
MRVLSLFRDPVGFHQRRFTDMRQQSGQENKWQFVTTSPGYLSFGHGKYLYPGRVFAANEATVVLVYLLVSFEWKLTAEGPKDKFQGETVQHRP